MTGGAGRNDDVIAAALTAVAQAVAQTQVNGGHGQEDQGEVEERSLDDMFKYVNYMIIVLLVLNLHALSVYMGLLCVCTKLMKNDVVDS